MVVNSKFSVIEEFIASLPAIFEGSGNLLHKGRNVVKEFDVHGIKVVVKSFGKIPGINKFVYSWLRKSKAQRSYEYSRYFLENGFNSPEPVAWLDCINGGLLRECYYVSLRTGYSPLENVLGTPKEESVLMELAAFAYNLHQKGIYHGDFNVTNILYDQTQGKTLFSLIDNNRTRFGRFSHKRALQNFRRLTLEKRHFGIIARGYSQVSSMEESLVLEGIIRAREGFVKKIESKARAKRFLRKK